MKKKTDKERLFEIFEKVDPTFKRRIDENDQNLNTDDPTKEEMVNFLKNNFKGLLDPQDEESNIFDMEEAIYWFASDYYNGQWSNLYSVLSTSEYKPSPLMKGIEDADEMSQMMYKALESEFATNNEENKKGLKESLMLDGMKLDVPKELMKYYIGTDDDDRKFLFKVPTDDVVRFSKDDRWGKTFTYHPERVGDKQHMILYAPKKRTVKMDRVIHPREARSELGSWGKYYDPKESQKTPIGGPDPEDPSMGGQTFVLKIPKSEYPNQDELYKELDDEFDYVSHGVEGNPGGIVSRTGVSINPNKSTPEYWYVEIDKSAILDI